MTTQDESLRAVDNTRLFLLALLDPKRTPGVPRTIRQWASRLAKHYPNSALDLIDRSLRDEAR